MAELDPRDEAYQCFVQEAVDHLQALELGLLNLQRDHGTAKINDLMRHAHSLKGGASLFGLTASQDLAHQLENVFKALYGQTITIDAEVEELLLQVYDCLREPLLEQIEHQVYAPEPTWEIAKSIFAKLEAKFGFSLSDTVGLPEPDFLQIVQGLEASFPDLVLSATEADAQAQMQAVWHGLAEEFPDLLGAKSLANEPAYDADPTQLELLAQLLETELLSLIDLLQRPPVGQVAALLQVEIQKFAEIGEHFGAGGLVDIARTAATALRALGSNPFQVGQLLLQDLRYAQQQLVNRQPLIAIQPSSQLQALAVLAPPPRPQPPAIHPAAAHPPASTAAASTASASAPSGSTPSGSSTAMPVSVRVEVNRLDALNTLTGELVTLENGLLLQQQQYRNLADRLKRWHSEFNQLSRRLNEDVSVTISHNLLAQLQTLTPENKALFDDPDDDGLASAREVVQQITEQILDVVMQSVAGETFKLEELLQDFSATNKLHKSILGKQEQTLKQVQTNLLQARMVPLQDLLNRFPRMVRDLASRFGKQVQLNLPSQPIFVDKAMVEKLYDPLLHLIRNAFDHGIETPEQRQQHGKPVVGQISIDAYHRGNYTWITISDDGQGIRLSKIRSRLLQLKLCPPERVNCLDPEELYEYLFTPGFTTTEVANELSGRGMGLDAVQQQIAAMQGQVSVTSNLGIGTTFTLRLPYNQSVTQLLVFTVSRGAMAIPVQDLANVATVSADQLERQDQEWFWRTGDKLIPVLTQLQCPIHGQPERHLFAAHRTELGKSELTLLLLADRAEELAILIDQHLMQQDLVVKPFASLVKSPNYLTGCTILGDGRLVTVLDGAALIADWQVWRQAGYTYPEPSTSAPAIEATEDDTFILAEPDAVGTPAQKVAQKVPPTILVVDDSMTIRQNLTVFLRRSGYQVIQAADGAEGLERLRQTVTIHAVISDVDMPNMNGLEFLRHCRQNYPPEQLPIVMLTSRNTENYRQLAKRLGASAYLNKPYLENELLQTLENCLQATAPDLVGV